MDLPNGRAPVLGTAPCLPAALAEVAAGDKYTAVWRVTRGLVSADECQRTDVLVIAEMGFSLHCVPDRFICASVIVSYLQRWDFSASTYPVSYNLLLSYACELLLFCVMCELCVNHCVYSCIILHYSYYIANTFLFWFQHFTLLNSALLTLHADTVIWFI